MADVQTIRLTIPSNPACLTVVRALVERMSELAGFEPTEVDRIILAVDEALTNIIRHQYGGSPNHLIDVLAVLPCDGKRLDLTVRDYGDVRDPDTFCGREVGDVGPGGLGTRIIREVMDTVEYSPADGGGMQLRLTKVSGKA